MKLRFTPRATQDLLDIADYIRERSPNASLRVRAAILDSLQDLVLFPEAGRRQTIEGVRKFVTRKYSYLIYYIRTKVLTRSLFSRSSTRHANESMRMHSNPMLFQQQSQSMPSSAISAFFMKAGGRSSSTTSASGLKILK